MNIKSQAYSLGYQNHGVYVRGYKCVLDPTHSRFSPRVKMSSELCPVHICARERKLYHYYHLEGY